MDDTAKLVIEKFAAPVLSGVLGFAGAAFRFYLRIEKLERSVKTLRSSVQTGSTVQGELGKRLYDLDSRMQLVERLELQQALKSYETKHSNEIEALRAGMRLEIEHFRDELEAMITDIRSSIRTVEDSSHDFAKEAALATFMSQQAQRWETIQRTLGRIEGLMERGKS